jgi:sterol desaturase/sphingolipid hydroxylase (fatty acid hydroxylase superfamily)
VIGGPHCRIIDVQSLIFFLLIKTVRAHNRLPSVKPAQSSTRPGVNLRERANVIILQKISLPTLLLGVSTVIFFVMERARPGRQLPQSKGWYARAILVTLIQLAITLLTAGTFVFYWWHRLRHAKGWWLAFHQIHHSPSRIELLTSFYKHPIEILCDAILSAVILYPLMGCSLLGAFWYNFFAGTGEYFYHANVKTPPWLRFFIQTPELHSIHHQYDVHRHNFSDIPVWDRLFGTYRDTTQFVERCGFPMGAENKLIPMLAFTDVYVEGGEGTSALSAP